MNDRILVSPVAYNEHIKLKNVIERFLKSPLCGKVSYLIVDDGSTDGTTEMIESYAGRGVKTIKHPERSGVGAANFLSFTIRTLLLISASFLCAPVLEENPTSFATKVDNCLPSAG